VFGSWGSCLPMLLAVLASLASALTRSSCLSFVIFLDASLGCPLAPEVPYTPL